MSALDRGEVAEVVATSRFARVAVDGRNGPHVTPVAFAVADGQAWFFASSATLKVRAIRRSGRASLAFRDGRRCVVTCGSADVISVGLPEELGKGLRSPLSTFTAGALFTLRNADLLTAAAFDGLRGRGMGLPLDRVLVRLQPDRGMLIDGLEVTHRWGRWPKPSPLRAVGGQHLPNAIDERLPADLRRVLAQTREATVGWPSPSGAVALPGTVDRDGRIRVPEAALRLAGGLAQGPACCTRDLEAVLPSSFAGIVVRGQGRVISRRTGLVSLALDPEKVNWWRGFRAGTVGAPAG